MVDSDMGKPYNKGNNNDNRRITDMKRKLAAALVCALCLTLSACGGSGTAV